MPTIHSVTGSKVKDAYFRLLGEKASDIVYVLDPEGLFLYVNPAWEWIMGHRRQEVLGQPFIDFVPLENHSFFRTLFHRLKSSKESFNDIDALLMCRDGTLRRFSISAAPCSSDVDVFEGVAGICRDMTQRHTFERQLQGVRAYAEEIIDSAPEGIVLLHTDATVIRINREFTRLFGFTLEEMRATPLDDWIVPEELRQEGDELTGRAVRGERFEVETRRKHKDGKRIDVSILVTPITFEDGQVGIYGIYRDISARKRAQEALKRSEALYRTVLESAPDPVIVRDIHWNVVYFNQAFTRVFGWSLEEKIGQRMNFVPPEHLPEALSMMEQVREGRAFSAVETRRLTKNGRGIDVSISGAVFFDSDGKPEGCVNTIQDITERKKIDAELEYVAYHDPLTGLPNRQALYIYLADLLHRSRRRSDTGWALLFMDLDRFKQINDALGHEQGDELILAVAKRVKNCLRTMDHFSRIGGDEFAVVLNDPASSIDVATVAEKIRHEVARPFTIAGQLLETSVSIGISLFPDDGSSLDILVKNADMAMYTAKEGREGYRFFTEEMNRTILHRMKMEVSLQSALRRGELLLYYQPLVGRGNRIAGVEALLRWNHPEFGIISPSNFIPVAEETGAILPIGKWVLHTACSQVKKWQDRMGRELFVSVNLSARQFRDPDLLKTVKEALESSGLAPRSLKLEVTESSVMEQPEHCIRIMEELKKWDISFSIDDFGTGYSSLSYLKRFPIDALKIDRSFVTDALACRDDQEIIKTIISMARNLQLETIAEGVETLEQQEFLSGLDCGVMQGFLFGRPVPPEQFESQFGQMDGAVGHA